MYMFLHDAMVCGLKAKGQRLKALHEFKLGACDLPELKAVCETCPGSGHNSIRNVNVAHSANRQRRNWQKKPAQEQATKGGRGTYVTAFALTSLQHETTVDIHSHLSCSGLELIIYVSFQFTAYAAMANPSLHGRLTDTSVERAKDAKIFLCEKELFGP